MKSVLLEIWSAFKKPWKEPSFILYFIFMVLGFGGIGIFMSIYQYRYYAPQGDEALHLMTKSAIAQSIMTYAIAILIPAALSIFLHLIAPKAKHKISHSIITITILLIVILLVCFTYIDGNMWVASFSALVAWLFWIVANSDNESLKDGSYNAMIKKEVNKHGQGWN